MKQPSTQKLMSASPNKRVSNHELRHLYEEVLRLRELAAQSAKAAANQSPEFSGGHLPKPQSHRNLDAPVPRIAPRERSSRAAEVPAPTQKDEIYA